MEPPGPLTFGIAGPLLFSVRCPVVAVEHQLVAARNPPCQLHDGKEVGRRGPSSPAPLQRSAVGYAHEIGHLPPGDAGLCYE